MKPIFSIIIVLIVFITGLAPPTQARDFIVQFEEENYKETRASHSYLPVIYHSIQVNTEAGSKLLVLTGDDYNYRKWLRHYIAGGKAFIIKVPPEQRDLFVKSSVFDIDVTRVHPIDLEQFKQGEEKTREEQIERTDIPRLASNSVLPPKPITAPGPQDPVENQTPKQPNHPVVTQMNQQFETYKKRVQEMELAREKDIEAWIRHYEEQRQRKP